MKVNDLIEYMKEHYPDIYVEPTFMNNGIKWRQESQDIDKKLEHDLRVFLGDSLIEFFWISSYQFVFIK